MLSARRQNIVGLLERQLSKATATSAEVNVAAQVLRTLAGEPQAANALLNHHSQKIRQQQQLLLRQHSAGVFLIDECADQMLSVDICLIRSVFMTLPKNACT